MSDFLPLLLVVVVSVAVRVIAQQGIRTTDMGAIVFSSVVHRHGDRAPTETYPTDPYGNEKKFWPRGFSQLTEAGEEQHLQLGRFLRQRYAKMLPLRYNHEDVYVRSTDVDRTLNSARCNLAGLYPDITKPSAGKHVTFQAIPVHTEKIENDFLLKSFENCRKQKLLLSMLKNSTGYKCVMKHAQKMHRQIARSASVSTFPQEFYDILLVQDTYNLPLPKWTLPFYPAPLKHFHLFDVFMAPSGFTEVQKLTAGPLVTKIVDDMLDKINGQLKPDRKLFIYSGHDSNVVDLLQALKVFNGILVPYASAFILELREKNKQHFVTVSFRNTTNGDAHFLRLPKCETMCPIDQFVELVQPIITDDIKAECNKEVEEGSEHSFEVHENAVPTEWRHCFEKQRIHNGVYYVIKFVVPFNELHDSSAINFNV